MNLLELSETLRLNLVYGALLWTRLLGVVATVPFLFGKPVPRNVRVAVAFVLMMFFYPHLKPAEMPPILQDNIMVTLLFIKEALVGVIIGLGASMLFYGFDGAGRMVDNQRGMSLARILIPQLNEMGSVTGQFMFQMAIVIYLVLGGHHQFFSALTDSYIQIPLFGFPDMQAGFPALIQLFATMTGQVIILSMQIAGPVILAILIADIILSVTNRVAPQINVWELGFNIKGYVGILMLFLSLTLIVQQMAKESQALNQQTYWVIDLLRGEIPEPLKADVVPSETPTPTPSPTPP